VHKERLTSKKSAKTKKQQSSKNEKRRQRLNVKKR